MRHRLAGRKLGRTSSHRKAMFDNMAHALLKHEQITTTLPKAKDLRPIVEKLITIGKRRRLHAVEELQKRIATEINARYLGRTVDVLVEGTSKGRWYGRTRTNKLVHFLGDASLAGLPPQAGLYACLYGGLVFWSRTSLSGLLCAILLGLVAIFSSDLLRVEGLEERIGRS